MEKVEIVRKLWEIGAIDPYTSAEVELKDIGIENPSHKQKMRLAKWIGVPRFKTKRKKYWFARGNFFVT